MAAFCCGERSHYSAADVDSCHTLAATPSVSGCCREDSLSAGALVFRSNILCSVAWSGPRGNDPFVDGPQLIEWSAPDTEAGVDMHVEALEGEGGYHLSVRVIGTTERLSREAELNKDVTMQIDGDLDHACTYRYGSLEMRGDGDDFVLKIQMTTGFTYNFTTSLLAGDASRIRVGIHPPKAVAQGSDAVARAGDCRIASAASQRSEDEGELSVGRFPVAGGGRQSWGAKHCAAVRGIAWTDWRV